MLLGCWVVYNWTVFDFWRTGFNLLPSEIIHRGGPIPFNTESDSDVFQNLVAYILDSVVLAVRLDFVDDWVSEVHIFIKFLRKSINFFSNTINFQKIFFFFFFIISFFLLIFIENKKYIIFLLLVF